VKITQPPRSRETQTQWFISNDWLQLMLLQPLDLRLPILRQAAALKSPSWWSSSSTTSVHLKPIRVAAIVVLNCCVAAAWLDALQSADRAGMCSCWFFPVKGDEIQKTSADRSLLD